NYARLPGKAGGFPNRLKKLDYPEGQDQANFDGRFLTIALAFEKHRHKNWDFVVTSPNISKVHPVVRSCSESAYKHKNLATLGRFFKGRYVEGYHSADTNGKPSDFYSILRKRIPAYVFDLYQSTATGQHSDTIAGQSLFKDPKILGLLVFLVLVIIAAISMGTPKIVDKTLHNTHTETVPASGAVDSKKAGSAPGASPGFRPAVVGSGAVPALPPRLRFLTASQKILITGTYSVGSRKHFFLRVFLNGGQYFELSDSQAAGLGLSVSQLTPCYFILSAGGVTSYAFCEEELPPDSKADASPANSTQVASSQPEGAAPP
ncbi:zonular occludens toxin domain-containing protein, partial [Candidatus Thiothrix sp. Deng01]